MRAVLSPSVLIQYSQVFIKGSGEPAGPLTRIGLGFSGVFMIGVAVWIFSVFSGLFTLGSLALAVPGVMIFFWA